MSGRGVEDNVALLLEYPGGAYSVAESSFVAGAPYYSIDISGAEGVIVLAPGEQSVLVRKTGSPSWEEQERRPAPPNPLDQFVAALGLPAPNPEHLLAAVRLTQIIQASYKSARSGAALYLTDLQL